MRFADLPMIEGATGKFLLQQMAAVAGLEAGMISARTKAALAAAKRRGYVFSTCGFGQLVSTFTQTQVAAVFATTVLSVIPTVNFSGLLVPASSLTGQGGLSA